MTLRRALWAFPLAVSVAVLAHLAAFGFAHAPGAEHSPVLLGALATTLGLALLGNFTGGLLGRPGRPIATERLYGYAPLLLALAGVGAFGLIELSEGHFALGALLQAALASIPLAYLVAFAARSARRAAHQAGAICARYASRKNGRNSSASATLARRRSHLPVASPIARGTSRGRAPPLPI